MLRKFFIGLIAVTLLLIPATALAQKTYHAEEFNVVAVLEEDGSLLVTETVIFNFSDGEFTYVFREIPQEKVDGITMVSASMNGQMLTSGTQAGQVEVQRGDPLKITWHFAPTADSSHTFTLIYRMQGIVEKTTGADVLRWQPLPDDYEYSIQSSDISLSYPQSAVPNGEPRIEYGNATITSSDGEISISARDLQPNDTLIMRMEFAPGSIVTSAPQWQAKGEQARKNMPIALGISGGIFVIGTAIAIAYALSYRGTNSDAEPAPYRYSDLPSKRSPAIVNILSYNSDSTWYGAIGTLFNLAQKGVLRFANQVTEPKWYQQHNFVIELQPHTQKLEAYEQGLLDILFQTRKGPRKVVNIQKLANEYATHNKAYTQPLKEALSQAGLLSDTREKAQNRLLIYGAFGALLSFIVILILVIGVLPFAVWPAILVPLGLIGTSLITIIIGASLSTLSDDGLTEKAAWKAFSQHLIAITRDKESYVSSKVFEQYLPYAMALGIADRWVRYFEKQSNIPLPTWFQDNLANGQVANWGVFIAMISTTNNASSSAGVAGGAAGAGAAGGGASGAG